MCLFLEIRHSIEYRYQSAVFVEPLTLRLLPRSDVFQRLIGHDLEISPLPAGRSDSVDLEGNSSTVLWFDRTCEHLSLVATSRVETLCTNPFAFIITDQQASSVPAVYPEDMKTLLEPYLSRAEPTQDLESFASDAIREAGAQTVPFLCALARLIAEEFTKVVRRKGQPAPPSVTLRTRQGACRDLTVLFMEICRSVGLATRFVSGYTEGYQKKVRRELHAWAEVYLPGGGWRGFDPTLGLAVADRHVAVAACPLGPGASPTTGTFRGDAAGSTMEYEVSVVRTTPEGNREEPQDHDA